MRIATDVDIPVHLLGLRPEMLLGLLIVDQVFQDQTGKEATITSICDGKHQPRSLHFKGCAVDFRTRHLKPPNAAADAIEHIAAECRRRLGREFDVVVSARNLHVEWDPED